MGLLFVIVFFVTGIFFGRLFHTFPWVKLISDRLMMWAVYLLLFLLGISVGHNPQIIENIHTLGWQALLLAVGAMGGSLFLGKLLMLFYGKAMGKNGGGHEK